MPYIIDGHNLIGKIPDLHLADIDDEEKLIQRVLAFCASKGKTAEIYFDKAPAGHARRKRFGRVTAIFVQSASTADLAIRRRLADLRKAARNQVVVSSDRQVQADARAVGASVITADEFSRLLSDTAGYSPQKGDSETAVSDQEVQEWLDIFKGGDRQT